MSEYMERHTVSPPDRRASRLCRLRPGRPADRRRRPASALRAAARRDREGPSGPLQHPPADHGPREADRPQRQAGRLPQRHPDHDHQCRRGRPRQAGHRLHADQARRRGQRGDQPPVRAGIPQPPRRGHLLRPAAARGRLQGGRQVRAAARGAARRPQRHDRAHRRGARLAGRERLRRDDGRAADGPAHPVARSRRRWPTRCCSAGSRTAARCA